MQTPSGPGTPSQPSRQPTQAAVGGICYRFVQWTLVNACCSKQSIAATAPAGSVLCSGPPYTASQAERSVKPVCCGWQLCWQLARESFICTQPSRQILAVYSFGCCMHCAHKQSHLHHHILPSVDACPSSCRTALRSSSSSQLAQTPSRPRTPLQPSRQLTQAAAAATFCR